MLNHFKPRVFKINQSINPILIRVYPRKRGWPDLPHSNSNLSNQKLTKGFIDTDNLDFMTIFHRFKCVPPILGYLSIHIFNLF